MAKDVTRPNCESGLADSDEIKIEWWPPQPTKGMLTGTNSKGIKITHIKSGISVTCEKYRNQHQNKQGAMCLLEEKLRMAIKPN